MFQKGVHWHSQCTPFCDLNCYKIAVLMHPKITIYKSPNIKNDD